MKDPVGLLKYLLSLSEGESFVEFKTNFDKERDGKNISAVANSAVLKGQDFGYIVYGIEDGTKNIIGTNFDPNNEKVGNQALKIWIAQKLTPKIPVEFYPIRIDDKNVVIAEIESAKSIPIKFDNEAYIRIGESTTNLKHHPNLEQKIWNNDRNKHFEKNKIKEGLTSEQVLQLLDYDKYFQLTKQELPTQTKGFVDKLVQEKFVLKENDNSYSISTLGAILLARNIDEFDIIKKKSVRIITYEGNSKEKRKSDIEGKKGYASGFENMIEYIIQQVGNNEVITQSVRIDNKKYPPLTLREFIANALIHQDFSITGAGPMIEIFDNRIEIINPGIPLIDTDRFIDHPPRTRNEDLASLMRRLGFCEESGSGVDRALIHIELYQLPAPKFEIYEDFTKVTLFASKTLNEMSESDKVRACYQHCVLMHLKGEEKMQNASLRQRLNIPESNYPAASKIIALTLKKGKIKQGEKPKEYIPRWA